MSLSKLYSETKREFERRCHQIIDEMKGRELLQGHEFVKGRTTEPTNGVVVIETKSVGGLTFVHWLPADLFDRSDMKEIGDYIQRRMTPDA